MKSVELGKITDHSVVSMREKLRLGGGEEGKGNI